jgi:hypothetical protein
MKKIAYLFALSGGALFASCTGAPTLPTSTGAAGEILMVINEDVFKSNVGDSIVQILNHDVPCMPQSEPMFNISRTNFEGFTSIIKPARNIILIDAGRAYSSVKIKTEEDKWGKPQAILTIQGPTTQEVADAIGKYKVQIANYFVKAERDRAIKHHQRYTEKEMVKKVEEHMGFYMAVPRNMVRCKKAENFMWISNNAGNMNRNIVLYSYPYTEADAFTRAKLLQKRDSVMKLHIPGPVENSYMTTEYRFEPPIWEETAMANKQYAIRIQGMWRVEGEYMGGPFVSISCLDQKNQRIITAEAFIYAPNQYKRNAMRQLEAALYTIKP